MKSENVLQAMVVWLCERKRDWGGRGGGGAGTEVLEAVHEWKIYTQCVIVVIAHLSLLSFIFLRCFSSLFVVCMGVSRRCSRAVVNPPTNFIDSVADRS